MALEDRGALGVVTTSSSSLRMLLRNRKWAEGENRKRSVHAVELTPLELLVVLLVVLVVVFSRSASSLAPSIQNQIQMTLLSRRKFTDTDTDTDTHTHAPTHPHRPTPTR